MSLKMQQQLAMKQQLRMTLQLQQAIKLLQLSKMELVSQIQTEMTENPALEELPDIDPTEPTAASLRVQERDVNDAQEGEPRAEFDWERYLRDYQESKALPQNSYKGMITDELPSYEATLSAPPSLAEHLLWQVQLSRLDEEQKLVAEEIVGNLNEDGYLLDPPLEKLAERCGVDMDTAEYVLETLQEMDPVGVASRSLKECLLVQAELSDPDDDLLLAVIEDHIHNLERKNYDAIAKALKVSIEEIYQVAKVISEMDPKPGRKYTNERPQYITPDIFVIKMEDGYRVVLNEDGLPKLRVSPYYAQMAKLASSNKEGSYIRDKLAGARWLIRSIHQRQRTIHRVTEAIIRRQKDFLDKGVAYLKPMVLKDIADETNLHESTISRVTNKKYVHTPQGTFELKYFFNSRISRATGVGDDLASESVKERIKSIISQEDPQHPYSDQKIVQLLRQQNIKIARRTVAKYREALGILSSTQRKSFF
ncbi:MAG: RNA polymerase factor sigma-54 [Myxococcota bacterium]|nr:RNA polymerase factor sigma-54 [Myxococcota bacterium]